MHAIPHPTKKATVKSYRSSLQQTLSTLYRFHCTILKTHWQQTASLIEELFYLNRGLDSVVLGKKKKSLRF